MNDKEKYLQTLKADDGRHDEITLGKSLRFDEETTRRLISQLLAEYKIEFLSNGLSNYKAK